MQLRSPPPSKPLLKLPGRSLSLKKKPQGLHKLQLIKEAKRLCPDLVRPRTLPLLLQRGPPILLTRVSQVVVLGEDLTRFRNASKLLYRFLRQFSWNGRVESKFALAFRLHLTPDY